MAGLFFVVVCAVGILRPIKNALALDGLADTQFYRVYVVSAFVVLFIPLYNRLADHVRWRKLLPGVAFFFAAVLVIFRFFYREGSAAYGMLFYGWYDLLGAVMVTQFFMATQLYFDARGARRAYPIVIAGGSLGATLGGAVTGFAAETFGIPNLILVAALLITAFGLGLPFVWTEAAGPDEGVREVAPEEKEADLSAVAENSQVRLIAAVVLLTVIVKQLVDYQFNTITKEVFVDPAAIAGFQGWFNTATQWLPLVVLAGLQPLLSRWGVGVALFLLPVFMLLANAGLALTWSLPAAVIAKGGDTGIRYAAERTAREILYLPVPEAVKMRAKGYIDVALEKGMGKVLSALVIYLLLAAVGYRHVGWFAVGLSLLWLPVAAAVRSEYVHSLAGAMKQRVASLRGLFASLTGASTLSVVQEALREGDRLQTSFVLDFLEQAPDEDLAELEGELLPLLEHEEPEIRVRALEVLTRVPGGADPGAVWARLADPEEMVRVAAVRALVEGSEADAAETMHRLIHDPRPDVRVSALRYGVRHGLGEEISGELGPSYLQDRWSEAREGDRQARLEVALAAGAFADHGRSPWLARLLDDPDPEVASAAALSSGRTDDPSLRVRLVGALKRPAVREAARDALARQGEDAIPELARTLEDESVPSRVRRHVPDVLARIPSQASVDALVAAYAAPETDQLLDFRTLKALNKLRARPTKPLRFEGEALRPPLGRELAAAGRYRRARRTLEEAPGRGDGRALPLLVRSLAEAIDRRRESAFRCLGLLYPPAEVHRCYLSLASGSRKARGNAMEWLEETVGRELYGELRPVLPGDDGPASRSPSGEPWEVAADLANDKDRWIARCALWSAYELRGDGIADWLDSYRPSASELETTVDHVRARIADGNGSLPSSRSREMDLVQKVFLLQGVDLLAGARSEHLALVADLAREVVAGEGQTLIQRGEPGEAMYVVVDGAVELRGEGERLAADSVGDAFGTWSLIDEEPSLVEATTTERSRLLRLQRNDFQDLLTETPEMALGLLRGFSRRVRGLADI